VDRETTLYPTHTHTHTKQDAPLLNNDNDNPETASLSLEEYAKRVCARLGIPVHGGGGGEGRYVSACVRVDCSFYRNMDFIKFGLCVSIC
jgi:hypothetical protein